MSRWQSWYEAYRATKQDEIKIKLDIDWFELVLSIVCGMWLLRVLEIL